MALYSQNRLPAAISWRIAATSMGRTHVGVSLLGCRVLFIVLVSTGHRVAFNCSHKRVHRSSRVPYRRRECHS